VKAKRILEDGSIHTITVASLEDGSHFGDVATVTRRDEVEAEQHRQREKITAKIDNLGYVQKQNKIYDEQNKMEEESSPRENKSQKKEENLTDKNKLPNPTENSNMLPKRTTSIECAEPCEILVLERENYEAVLSEILNKDVNTKLNLLSLIPFFKVIFPI